MGERVRYGLVTLVPAYGWERAAPSGFGARPRRVREHVLRSPRSDGRFRIDTVAMPEDMGAFDVDRLRRLEERRAESLAGVLWKAFDETPWTDSGIAGVARSNVASVAPADAAKRREILAFLNEEQRAEIERFLSAPMVRRDWLLACGSDMANIAYCCSNGDAVAADLGDCEEMVRSVRFGSGS